MTNQKAGAGSRYQGSQLAPRKAAHARTGIICSVATLKPLQIRLTPSLHAFNVFKLIQNSKKMADNDVDVNEELLDYEDEPETETTEAPKAEDAAKNGKVKGNYVSIHSSGFRDFLLKPEVLRSIGDCGFEHPSEVQHECIPQVKHFIL